jgi:CheY-like chemotaxis protein
LPNFIIVDITRIKQILTNLMGNSAKFTEEGAITLDVSIEQKILSLKVSDTGIGIAENNLDKVFNSFVQADGSTTRKFGGTGLGLSLCKELCEIMNGSIEVESVFGEGTSFTVKIPIELGQPTPEIVTNSLSSERIVYIDNDHNNLKSLKKMASELNISLSTYTPQDCLVALQEKTWDIILIDQLSIKNNILDILPKQTDAKIINIHRTLCNSFATNNLFHHHLARPFSHKHFISLLNAKTNTKIITSINEFDVTGGVKTKILIVEDNKSNQFLMKKVLQNKYDFDFANNGLEAVNAVKEHDYDIILMDILMPVMDGLQATEKIRTFNKEIPILALTANNLASDREKCINSGMNDFIVKPINRQFLIEKIEEFSNPLS